MHAAVLERWRFRSARAEWPILSTFLCSERSGRINYLKTDQENRPPDPLLKISLQNELYAKNNTYML